MRYSNLITYAAMAFIVYAVLTNHYGEIKKTVHDNIATLKSMPAATPPDKMAKGSYMEKKIAGVMESFVQTESGKKFMTAIIKKSPGSNENSTGSDIGKLDTLVGNGQPVVCGQTVTLHYASMLEDGKVIDSTRTSNHPITFTVGERKVLKGLELGVVGVKKNGIRKLTVPGNLAYDNPQFTTSLVPFGSTITIELELLGMTPELKEPLQPVSINDVSLGNGRVANCGDTVVIKYSIVGSKDVPKPFAMQLGNKKAPIGLSEGVSGMKMGGVRTIILPQQMLRTLGGEVSPLLKSLTTAPGVPLQLQVELVTVG